MPSKFTLVILCSILAMASSGGIHADEATPHATLMDVSAAFRQVATRVVPCTVTIQTTYRRELRASLLAPEFDTSESSHESGEGTGVVYDKKGFVITSYHVIKDAIRIEVVCNGESVRAELVGVDPKTDLALLKVHTQQELSEAMWGDSDLAQVGDWAVAIGNALGFSHTVTVGIVSAKGRTGLRDEKGVYEDFIQTDAAINRGNSGGPLCNIAGEVIGINAMIASVSGGSQGLGFAIPSNMVRHVIDQLLNKGRVSRGYLGISIDDLTAKFEQQFKYQGKGCIVQEVKPGSPAQAAGLQLGDLIVTFDGKPVQGSPALRNKVAHLNPGTQIRLGIHREGSLKDVEITIGSLDGRGSYEDFELGLKVRAAYPEELTQWNETFGVFIEAVKTDSPAQASGLIPGWMIISVDKVPVIGPQDLLDRVRRSLEEHDREALLYIKTTSKGSFIVLRR